MRVHLSSTTQFYFSTTIRITDNGLKYLKSIIKYTYLYSWIMNVIQLISLVPVGRPPLIHDGKYYITYTLSSRLWGRFVHVFLNIKFHGKHVNYVSIYLLGVISHTRTLDYVLDRGRYVTIFLSLDILMYQHAALSFQLICKYFKGFRVLGYSEVLKF